DDLVRILDVAGLAVHAVRRVDLQPAAAFVLDHLVDVGRAEAGAGVAVLDGAALHADGGVMHDQVDGLVLVVVGGGEVHAGQAVGGGAVAVAPAAVGRPVRGQLLQRAAVGLVLQRPRGTAAGDGLPAGVGDAHPQALLEA